MAVLRSFEWRIDLERDRTAGAATAHAAIRMHSVGVREGWWTARFGKCIKLAQVISDGVPVGFVRDKDVNLGNQSVCALVQVGNWHEGMAVTGEAWRYRTTLIAESTPESR
jgi:hypothetical protein